MRISQLAQATTVNDEDVFPVVQDGETKKVTAKALFDNQPTDIVIDEENNLQLMAGDKPVGEGVPMPDIDQTYNPTSSNAQSGVAVAEATKEVKDYAKNTLANAIKGSVSGTVISIDDISPIEHVVSLKVENKNLIPFTDKSYFGGRYVAGQTYEVNGVSYTVNDDGSIYAVGTATDGASIFYLYYVSTYETGTDTVTLSGSPEGATNTTYFLRLKNGTSANSNYQDYGNGVTINNVDVKGSVITIIVMNGQTVDATFYPQLEYGTTATEFSTPIDVSTVTVTEETTGVTYTPNVDGTCDVVSVSPTMTLSTDTDNITIKCEYNSDINKVIENFSQENTYRFDIAELSNTQIPNDILFNVLERNDKDADTCLEVAYVLHTALQNTETGEITKLIDIPAQYDNYIELLGNSFNNYWNFSSPCIYNESVFGKTPVTFSTIGKTLFDAGYCTEYEEIVTSYSAFYTPLSKVRYKLIGLRFGASLSFATTEIKNAVMEQYINPTMSSNTHIGITYKKPAPIVDCGYIGG